MNAEIEFDRLGRLRVLGLFAYFLDLPDRTNRLHLYPDDCDRPNHPPLWRLHRLNISIETPQVIWTILWL